MFDGFELLVDRQALCGEGPLWVPARQCLHWVDILRRELHTYHAGTEVDEVVVLPTVVTAVAAAPNNHLVGAAGMGFAHVDPARGGVRPVTTVWRGDRMNDGCCDPVGRFLAGTLTHDRKPGASALYVLDGAGARMVVGGLTAANGPAFSPDGRTMYLVDTGPRTIWAHPYDAQAGRAGPGHRWVVCSEREGAPDGIAVDTEGCVWVAMNWTGRIHRYRPDGDLETVLWAPTRRITSLAFGGPDLDQMYVTSACCGYQERDFAHDPYAGALFRFRPGATGLPVTPWNGR